MAASLAQGKLREARFFRGALRAIEGDSRLDQEEEFGFNLSAFLSAGRSVSFVLRKENSAIYESVSSDFLNSLTAPELETLNFMKTQRNASEKEGTIATGREINLVDWWDVDPTARMGRPSGIWEGKIGVQNYSFKINGREEPVIKVCDSYLNILERLVGRFESL